MDSYSELTKNRCFIIICLMDFTKIIKLIENTDSILICAGAGMGVDSGLPDFRGNEGFWNAYPPYKNLGLGFTDMANPSWFDTKPEFAWGFYGHRLNLYRDTIHHNGFNILLDMVNERKDYFVFTSNVDGQFQKAGFSENKIVECHGSIHHLQCSKGCNDIWKADNLNLKIDKDTMKSISQLPKCSVCGAIARPNILMFDDWNWISDRTESQYDRLNTWLSKNKKNIIIEIGAGSAVPTVRNMSENILKHYNSVLIRINTREPKTPKGNVSLKMNALEALELITYK